MMEEGKGNVSNMFARKSMAVLKAEAEETEVQALVTHGGVPLKRTLSAWSLIGRGATIDLHDLCHPSYCRRRDGR